MAVRVPVQAAFLSIPPAASHIGAVSEDEIAEAIRLYYATTTIWPKGQGGALAAGPGEGKDRLKSKKVGLVLSGGNIDRPLYQTVLAGGTPTV
ncbi:MAG: hypothetical protein R3D85_17210 [Paracoccaceae bacterium]